MTAVDEKNGLGFLLDTLPPAAPCYVAFVRPGGFADKYGVKPGDELFQVNNTSINDMGSPQYMLTMLKSENVLELRFRRQFDFDFQSNFDYVVSQDKLDVDALIAGGQTGAA